MRYQVQVLNDSLKEFDSIESALDYAARHVYLPWEQGQLALTRLKSGITYSYSYGFLSADIIPIPQPKVPMPGDAVRLTKRYHGADQGEIGIIGGMIGEPKDHYNITFKYSAYRDDQYVSCSGGPGTIATPASKLKPTGLTTKVWFWKFKDGIREANNDEIYYMYVPVWEWDGSNDNE